MVTENVGNKPCRTCGVGHHRCGKCDRCEKDEAEDDQEWQRWLRRRERRLEVVKTWS
jgi:hypothetical protein